MTLSTSTRLFASWWRSGGNVEPTAREDSFSATLPSRLPGADFQARFMVHWTAPDPAAVWNPLRGWLQEQARAVTTRWGVTQLDSAQNELHCRLGRNRALANGVHIFSCSIALTASAEAVESATRCDELNRQLSVVRREHELELVHLRYLRDKVFSQPSIARAYWLSRHPECLDDMLDDRFERIAVSFGKPSEARVQTIANVLDEFLRGLGDADRRYLLAQLDRVFTSYGRPDLNARLPAPERTGDSRAGASNSGHAG